MKLEKKEILRCRGHGWTNLKDDQYLVTMRMEVVMAMMAVIMVYVMWYGVSGLALV